MSAREILSKVAAELRPASDSTAVEERLQSLRERIKEVAEHAELVPGGSYAKGTYIKGSHDIDCFVRFPIGTTDEQMATALQEAFPRGEVLHGSRDYLQLHEDEFTFELVPVLAISSHNEAQNLMDMSPFHVDYIKEHLNEQQRDDARLAKQFCKAAGIYGAESFIRGFSGYVLELLISIYGSFEALLAAAANEWNDQVLLDPAQHYDSASQALRRLNEAKTLSPIIIVDPVQKDRNAAAALSEQSFAKFKRAASQFLSTPSELFFDIDHEQTTITERWSDKHVFMVRAQTPEGKRDIVGCQVLAKHEDALKLFTEHEFPLLETGWRFGEKESTAWYVLEATELSPTREQRGPPVDMREAAEAFRLTHASREVFARDGRFYAIVPRGFTQATQVIEKAWQELQHITSQNSLKLP